MDDQEWSETEVGSSADPLLRTRMGSYLLVQKLGGGAMGDVYRAMGSSGEVAVKVVRKDIGFDPTLLRRFEREARAAGAIRHPNIVSVFEYGKDRGYDYLAMELLRGRTLEAAIEAREKFDPPRAGHIVRQIALGLAAVHAGGVIHRDLKPANVMLLEDDHAKLLDFGLVAVEKPGAEETQLTATGHFVGTPIYVAPEQIFQRRVNAFADLYALGVILYELLAGVPPFDGAVSEVLMAHASKPPPPLQPAAGLDALAMRLLAKKPEARPPNATAVAAEIERLFAPPPVSWWSRLRRWLAAPVRR